jgi:hypothetical protein
MARSMSQSIDADSEGCEEGFEDVEGSKGGLDDVEGDVELAAGAAS